MLLKANIFQRVIRYKRIKSWAKSTQNTALLNCLFLFMYNLTLPYSIWFPINMEGSKRITTRIDHLSWSTSTGEKNQKRCNLMTELLLFKNTSNCYGSNLWESLWPSSQKRNNNSTFRKIKDCRHNAPVTKRVLKVSRLLVTVRILNEQCLN